LRIRILHNVSKGAKKGREKDRTARGVEEKKKKFFLLVQKEKAVYVYNKGGLSSAKDGRRGREKNLERAPSQKRGKGWGPHVPPTSISPQHSEGGKERRSVRRKRGKKEKSSDEESLRKMTATRRRSIKAKKEILRIQEGVFFVSKMVC